MPLAFRPRQTQLLESAHFVIQNLSSQGALALTGGTTVYVDPTALGYGWFEDSRRSIRRPFPNTYGYEVQAAASSPASDRMDLMTVVTHELGHVLRPVRLCARRASPTT